jgi:hypothetical protein
MEALEILLLTFNLELEPNMSSKASKILLISDLRNLKVLQGWCQKGGIENCMYPVKVKVSCLKKKSSVNNVGRCSEWAQIAYI